METRLFLTKQNFLYYNEKELYTKTGCGFFWISHFSPHNRERSCVAFLCNRKLRCNVPIT